MSDLKPRCAKYVGVPFRERGATPAGWDCWGLMHWTGVHELGKAWPTYEEAYAKLKNYGHDAVEQVMANFVGEWRRLPGPVEGCAVWFDKRGMTDDPRPYHVGLVLNDTEMLHVGVDTIGGTVIVPFRSIVRRPFLAGFWERP